MSDQFEAGGSQKGAQEKSWSSSTHPQMVDFKQRYLTGISSDLKVDHMDRVNIPE